MGVADAARNRVAIAERLRRRRRELEEALLTRIGALTGRSGVGDPEYRAGLRRAVAAGVDYGLAAVESPSAQPPQIPGELLVQARLAARNGVGLDVVLRRYFAGYALLADFLLEATDDGEPPDGFDLKGLLRAQAPLFDRLLGAVATEHRKEESSRPESADQRRAALVGKLLAAEPVDASQLSYPFEGWHLGLVTPMDRAAASLRDLARSLDRLALAVRDEEGVTWAWLGGARQFERAELECIAEWWPGPLPLALGEPAEGLAGWRLTHRQAKAAMAVAVRDGGTKPLRYGDVAVLAAALRDELLSTSLQQTYIDPLRRERDGGARARETLSAYFEAGRNVSATAAALGVSRQTAASRLRAIEARLGRRLDECAVAVEIAIRASALDGPWRGR